MKKLYITIGIIIGLLLSGTIVYATNYLAKDVIYNDTTVENALNDLYEEQNKKMESLGETYSKKYYSGTKNSTNEVSLELEKGIYVCSAIYGNTGYWSTLNVFEESAQTMTISNCDAYNELYNYQNFQSGTAKFSNTILVEVLVGKNFVCKVNDKKSINVSMASGEKNTGLPLGMEFACTKLNME